MWQRYELKDRAKFAFKANYGVCVLAALLYALFSGELLRNSGAGNPPAVNEELRNPGVYAQAFSSIIPILPFVLGVALIVLAVYAVIKAFLFNPLIVGGHKFFLLNAEGTADLNQFLYGFRSNYYNIVKTMFLVDVFLFLWTLLLVIPGIIKSYSYRMVPYILCENPDMDPLDAIQLSGEMMDGEKLDTFVLDLSFIGWHILSMLTFSLVGIFYVYPYVYATDAELYLVLKQNSVLRTKETDEYF